jgi:ABC-type branched-subunit amino acid transport system permease subunit
MIIVVIFSALYNSSIGKAWSSIGRDSRLAETLGVNVLRYRTIAFCIANATAALAGAFFAPTRLHNTGHLRDVHRTLYFNVRRAGEVSSRAFLGPVIGSPSWSFFPELMRFSNEAEPVITGVLIVIVVTCLPKGILGIKCLPRFTDDPTGTSANIFRKKKKEVGTAGQKGGDGA